jgi:ribosomal protein L37AE/L43A
MNDTNKLLTKLAEKLEQEGAKEEAQEVRKLFEDVQESAQANREALEGLGGKDGTTEVKIEAACPGCGSQMSGILFESLTETADKLDSLGAHKEADLVDGMIKKLAEDVTWQKEESKTEQSKRYDSKHNNEQTFNPNKVEKKPVKKTEHHVPEYRETKDTHLSTRYCPKHVGCSLHRVGEGIYQCELCGEKTNWADFGSIANQTSSTSNVPIPNRVFDSTQDPVGKIH